MTTSMTKLTEDHIRGQSAPDAQAAMTAPSGC